MTRQEKRNLKDLQHAERRARQKLYIETKERRNEPRPRPRLDIRTDDWEDLDIDLTLPSRRAAAARPSLSTPGLVIGIGPGTCKVLWEDQQLDCKTHPGIAVGDRVILSVNRRSIQGYLPRSTTLSRPDPHNPHAERVIAANIDIVVHVASVKSPPLRSGLIDRYLIAIQRSGAVPVLCVNKIDLLEDDAELAQLGPYRDLALPIIFCSAETGEGISELLTALAGRTCVFVGHSGVGKSSLLNVINPALALATNTVSQVHDKGRHTTAASTLYRIPNGATIIDTPGVREFGLWQISAKDLHSYFPEFEPHAPRCPFLDCSHTHEPDCAVKRAAEAGELPPARYDAYRRILASLSG